ncbi:DMT family transporter [Oceanospirillum beijerinckii]|uniref:DMT family transporter n=1 Tax=Oceanospirillum beijerinckii TaxID=64976 RepID=UPI000429BD1C|nr:DMT family transporter [Oceanospirillum beijerinckii]
MLQSQPPALLAAFWMLGALVSFATMAVAGRELSAEYTTFQILFFRSVIGVLIIGALVSRSGFAQLKTQRLKSHLVRNLAHFGGQYGWFYGLAFISLAEVIAIEFTTPVWTALFAFFLLGERLTKARITALVLGIFGLLLILRPGAGVLEPAALAVLAGAVGYALTYIQTKSLTSTETPLCILFYMTLMQMPLGMVPALMDWKSPSLEMMPMIILVGTTALSAHYCMTRAFKLADATVVVPMDFLRLPLIMVVGYLFYQESVDWFVLAGALLMLSGNLVNIRAEQNKLKAIQKGE